MLTDSELMTAGDPVWYLTSPSECEWQLYSLICWMGPWPWDQDLSQIHELVLWSSFPMVGYLSQHRYDETCYDRLFDCSRKVLPLLGSWDGGDVGQQEKG